MKLKSLFALVMALLFINVNSTHAGEKKKATQKTDACCSMKSDSKSMSKADNMDAGATSSSVSTERVSNQKTTAKTKMECCDMTKSSTKNTKTAYKHGSKDCCDEHDTMDSDGK